MSFETNLHGNLKKFNDHTKNWDEVECSILSNGTFIVRDVFSGTETSIKLDHVLYGKNMEKFAKKRKVKEDLIFSLSKDFHHTFKCKSQDILQEWIGTILSTVDSVKKHINPSTPTSNSLRSSFDLNENINNSRNLYPSAPDLFLPEDISSQEFIFEPNQRRKAPQPPVDQMPKPYPTEPCKDDQFRPIGEPHQPPYPGSNDAPYPSLPAPYSAVQPAPYPGSSHGIYMGSQPVSEPLGPFGPYQASPYPNQPSPGGQPAFNPGPQPYPPGQPGGYPPPMAGSYTGPYLGSYPQPATYPMQYPGSQPGGYPQPCIYGGMQPGCYGNEYPRKDSGQFVPSYPGPNSYPQYPGGSSQPAYPSLPGTPRNELGSINDSSAKYQSPAEMMRRNMS